MRVYPAIVNVHVDHNDHRTLGDDGSDNEV